MNEKGYLDYDKKFGTGWQEEDKEFWKTSDYWY
jgi:hypothetical protein